MTRQDHIDCAIDQLISDLFHPCYEALKRVQEGGMYDIEDIRAYLGGFQVLPAESRENIALQLAIQNLNDKEDGIEARTKRKKVA